MKINKVKWDGGDTINVGDQVPNYSLILENLEIRSAKLVGTNSTSNPVYRGDIFVRFSTTKTVSGANHFSEKSLGGLYITVDSSNKIESCSNLNPFDEGSLADLCINLGGTYDLVTKKCDIRPDFSDSVVRSEICIIVGGTPNGGNCTLPTPPPIYIPVVATPPLTEPHHLDHIQSKGLISNHNSLWSWRLVA